MTQWTTISTIYFVRPEPVYYPRFFAPDWDDRDTFRWAMEQWRLA